MRKFRIQRVSGAVLYAMLALTVGILSLFFFGGETPEEQRLVFDLSKEEPLYTDVLMYWMYALLGLAVLLTLGMMSYKFLLTWADSPREALRPLLGAGLLAVVLALSWLAGSSLPLDILGYDGQENSPFWLKLADMFLYTLYILLGLAVALIAGFSVMKKLR